MISPGGYAALVTALVPLGCRGPSVSRPHSDPVGAVQYLSQAALYSDIGAGAIAPENRPFSPRFELWSDGGVKRRWIRLPQGEGIDTSDMDAWIFPVGTIVWKEFAFLGRTVETRMLEKLDPEPGPRSWIVSTFLWDDAQRDAVRVNHGRADVAPTGLGTDHDVPSVDDCVTCHDAGGDVLLGFSAVQLAGPGAGIRLAELVADGRLSSPPVGEPVVPGDSEAQQVYGQLHAGCAHCHNPRKVGPVALTQLFLEIPAASVAERELPVWRTAVGRGTHVYQVPGRTLGLDSYEVEPGHPETSALSVRAHVRGDRAVAMPPLGTEVVDSGFVGRLDRWIEGL